MLGCRWQCVCPSQFRVTGIDPDQRRSLRSTGVNRSKFMTTIIGEEAMNAPIGAKSVTGIRKIQISRVLDYLASQKLSSSTAAATRD